MKQIINLYCVVANIAGCVEFQKPLNWPHINELHINENPAHINKLSTDAVKTFWESVEAEIGKKKSFGIASRTLNQALQYNDDPVQWWKHDELQKIFVPANDAEKEGLDLLAYFTGTGDRLHEDYYRHYLNVKPHGDDALRKPVNGYEDSDKCLQLGRIGFECGELVAILDRNNIKHTLKALTIDQTERLSEQPNLSVETDDDYLLGVKLITDKIMGDFLNTTGATRPDWKTCKRWICQAKVPNVAHVFYTGGPNIEYKLHAGALPFLKKKYAAYYDKCAKHKK
ncbi:hypothetical protein FCL47_14570 [Desulfopila sp. IMCC35006]|uniref:hypothetical protein n=1 Tax=Desulfopila sp. IMCC35006 TaxID=2569542 RepID=UPI0010AC79FB|nr:hypothetical protein [Desulfopila sp. IMCC35006]TKB25278.1 hypothetical protein FCL47_14570 [Desulfopila sp. IMCC35006]